MSETGLEPVRPFRDTRPSTVRVYRFHHPDIEPRPRFERGTFRLRNGCYFRLSYRGLSCGIWIRTRNLVVQSHARCQLRHTAMVGEEGFEPSRPRTPGFEAGAAAITPPAH